MASCVPKTVVNDNKITLEDRRLTIKELILFCHRENTEWKNIKNESKPEPMMLRRRLKMCFFLIT